jgi:hypothetical protein
MLLFRPAGFAEGRQGWAIMGDASMLVSVVRRLRLERKRRRMTGIHPAALSEVSWCEGHASIGHEWWVCKRQRPARCGRG